VKIILFIRSLELGGAERQLLNLARELSKHHQIIVLTFYNSNEYGAPNLSLKNLLILALNKRGRWDILAFLIKFLKIIRKEKPDVIYSFMNTACLISLLSPLVWSPVGIIWGIRSSDMRLSSYGKLPRLLRWLECRLSTFANLIISNSEAGHSQALTDGYKNRKIIVIANGLADDIFKRNDVSGHEIRQSLSIPNDGVVIGTVARHDPMKGLEVFLQSAKIHNTSFPSSYFLIIGSGAQEYTAFLKDYARSLGLQDRIAWVASTTNVAAYYNAMNIFTSTSIYGEGFSNAIGEAMLSEVPCVVTDVGDAMTIVGDRGIVVPAGSPHAVSAAWASLLKLSRLELQMVGSELRKRIAVHYSISSMAELTEVELKSVLQAAKKK